MILGILSIPLDLATPIQQGEWVANIKISKRAWESLLRLLRTCQSSGSIAYPLKMKCKVNTVDDLLMIAEGRILIEGEKEGPFPILRNGKTETWECNDGGNLVSLDTKFQINCLVACVFTLKAYPGRKIQDNYINPGVRLSMEGLWHMEVRDGQTLPPQSTPKKKRVIRVSEEESPSKRPKLGV